MQKLRCKEAAKVEAAKQLFAPRPRHATALRRVKHESGLAQIMRDACSVTLAFFVVGQDHT